jgi:formamidopyrimidine-DNA glycosylase
MPELPEMQALAERLDAHLKGKILKRIDVLQFSALKTFEPDIASLKGQELRGTDRRGKYVLFDFDEARLAMHLSQGGRVDLEEPPKSTRPKGAVARLNFGDAAMLLKEYGSERKAGLWVLAPGDDGPLAELGPEPYDEAFERLIMEGDDRRRIHTMLRDQRTVAGIGRGFTDEILHRARLSPYDTLASLDEDARRRLVAATRDSLDEGLARERKRKGGLPTKLEGRFRIHHHHGEPCPRCGDTMRRVSYESYEITYCPTCQTGGKILADRRMSRLLR